MKFLFVTVVASQTTLLGIQSLARNETFTELFSTCDFYSRQAIRGVFHDATSRSFELGNNGGVDGSIQYELGTTENKNIQDIVQEVQKFVARDVSFSDAFVLSSILALRSCGGPNIPFAIGRADATKPGPQHLLFPEIPGHDSQDKRAADMGLTPDDLLVLVAGGHSVATIQGGIPFDTTPDVFDTAFVEEMLAPPSQGDLSFARITSDKQMANSDEGKARFKGFAKRPSTLGVDFAKAFEKLCNLGYEGKLTTVKL